MASNGKQDSVFDYQEFNLQAGINEEESHQPNLSHDGNAVMDSHLTIHTTNFDENKPYQSDGMTIETTDKNKYGQGLPSDDSTVEGLKKNEVHFADLIDIEESSHSDEFRYGTTKEVGMKTDITNKSTIEDGTTDSLANNFNSMAIIHQEVSIHLTIPKNGTVLATNKDNQQNVNKEIEASAPGRMNEKHSIIKNLLVICLSFMLLFTAFQSMSALQSSINKVREIITLHTYHRYYIPHCTLVLTRH